MGHDPRLGTTALDGAKISMFKVKLDDLEDKATVQTISATARKKAVCRSCGSNRKYDDFKPCKGKEEEGGICFNRAEKRPL